MLTDYSKDSLTYLENLLAEEKRQRTTNYLARCFELQREIKKRIGTGHRISCQCPLCQAARVWQ